MAGEVGEAALCSLEMPESGGPTITDGKGTSLLEPSDTAKDRVAMKQGAGGYAFPDLSRLTAPKKRQLPS